MPSKSPYGPTFTSAVRRGTPCHTVVSNIAQKTGVSPTTIVNSLWRAGLIFRQKFNGQWVFWPSFPVKRNSTNAKTCQLNQWQNFIDWCITSGTCKPHQLNDGTGSQSSFISFCRKFFNKQVNGGPVGSTKSKPKRKTKRRSTRKTRKSTTRSFKNRRRPTTKRRGRTTRVRRAGTPKFRRTSSGNYKFAAYRRSYRKVA